jgi:hypothetical protein
MEKRKKLVGRPVMTTGKRSRKIDVRFSDDELAFVVKLEKLLGLKRSDIIRRKTLDVDLQLILDARSLLSSIDQIGLELSRSGNNINQLAKYANILIKQGVLSHILINRFLKELEKHDELMQSLAIDIRKILRMIGG